MLSSLMFPAKRIVPVVVALFCLIPTLGYADPPASPSPTAVATPTILEVKDIIPSLDETDRFLAELPERVRRSDSTTTLLEQVEALEDVLGQELETVDRTLRTASIKEIVRIEEQLHRRITAIEGWAEEVSRRLQALTEVQIEVQSKIKLWLSTYEKSRRDEAYKPFEVRTKEAIDKLRAQVKAIQEEVSRSALLQRRVAALNQRVKGKLESVLTSKREIRSELFVQDAPSFFRGEGDGFGSERLSFNAAEHLRATTEYFVSRVGTSVPHLFTMLFFGWGVFALSRRRLEKRPFSIVREHPISFFVAGVLASSLLLYGDAPDAFTFVLKVLLILPAAFVSYQILGAQYPGLITYCSALFICDLLNAFLRVSPRAFHTFLFFELLFAAFVCGEFFRKFTKHLYTKPEGERVWYLLLRWLAKLSSISCATSSAFLLMGFWRLGSYLGEAMLRIIYFGGVCFVLFALVLESVNVVPDIRFGRGVRSLSVHRQRLYQGTRFVLLIAALLTWGSVIVRSFGIKDEVLGGLGSVLNLSITVGGVVISVKGVLLFLIILFIGTQISRAARAFLSEDVYPRYSFDRGIQHGVDTAVNYIILFLSAFAALGGLGLNLQNLTFILGALSVGAGFGLQNLVNNMVSGVTVLAERPIKIGDLVTVGNNLGMVSRITMRSTTVRGFDGSETIVPNSKLVTEQIVNWTHTSTHGRVSITINVTHGTDIELCLKVLKNAVDSVSQFMQHPVPEVFFRGFNDSGLSFLVIAWVSDVNNKFAAENELWLVIWKRLKENKIELSYPRREVRIITESSGEKKVVGEVGE